MFREWMLIFALLYTVISDSSGASNQCGIRRQSFTSLVSRGYQVKEAEWPWHAGLFYKTSDGSPEYNCGGTLVDPKHILTAAHCLWIPETKNWIRAADIELHFGRHKLSSTSHHVQIRNVKEVHIHPDYSTHRNDIAVLEWESPVEYTDYVSPICLMDQPVYSDLRDLEGKRGWITGWGKLDSGVYPDVLRTASMPVAGYVDCLKDDRPMHGSLLDKDIFCAGDRNGKTFELLLLCAVNRDKVDQRGEV